MCAERQSHLKKLHSADGPAKFVRLEIGSELASFFDYAISAGRIFFIVPFRPIGLCLGDARDHDADPLQPVHRSNNLTILGRDEELTANCEHPMGM